jgi:hypothetical protein
MRRRIDNALYLADWVLGDGVPDRQPSELADVDDAARIRKAQARKAKDEYVDVRSDAEAFALPGWGPLLGRLRELGLPIQRVRSLVRSAFAGGTCESFLVCDADEDGKVVPYEVRVMANRERMPDVVCDHRSSRGEVPDRVAWCASPGDFAKVTASSQSRPVVKEGRFTGNVIGRAVAAKVNGFLDATRWATVYAKDPETAKAVADKAVADNAYRRTVWMARGPYFVYAVPLRGGKLGMAELLDLQRAYAELNRP